MRPETRRLYEVVTRKLSAQIADGQYAVGGRLPAERDLAIAFGVSRPTVREAMIALELDGLVEVKMGSGVYVKARNPVGGSASEADIGPFELLEARRAIEGEACALAAERMTQQTAEELRILVREMAEENPRDLARSEEVDRLFHMKIADATQNSAIVQTVRMLWEARERSAQYKALTRKVRAIGVAPRIDEHLAIVDALQRKDAASARHAMRDHLTRVIESLLEATESEAIEKARARTDEHRTRYVQRVKE